MTFSCESPEEIDMRWVKACFVVAADQLGLDPASLTRATPIQQKRAAGQAQAAWWGPVDSVPANPLGWPEVWTSLRGWAAQSLPEQIASAIGDLRGRFEVDRGGGGMGTCT